MTTQQNTQDPVAENVRRLIDYQKKDTGGDPSTVLLDQFTQSFLKPMILDKNIDLTEFNIKRASMYGILLPKKFTEFAITKQQYNQLSIPNTQKVEFLIEGKDTTEINVTFELLQPVFQNVWEYPQNAPRGNNVGFIQLAGGKEYSREIYETLRHTILGNDTIGNLLSDPKKIPIQINKVEKEINYDKNGNDTGKKKSDIKIKQTAKPLTGDVIISAKEENTKGVYKITIEVCNTSNIPIKPDQKSMYPTTVLPFSFFGTQLEVTSTSGNITSIDIKDECSSLNTSPMIVSNNKLFASPIGIIDLPRINPVKMNATLNDITKSEDALLTHLDMLDDNEKKILKNGKIGDLVKIFQALAKANTNTFDKLYKFQFDAIQIFLKNLLNGDSNPLIIRAPTDSGKSLVFYVCSVILKVMEDLSGTSTFVTFPTKALNATQFNDMSHFLYFLNLHGIDISIGYFTGSRADKDDPNSIVDAKNVTDGDPLRLLRKCPKCDGKDIVASKKNDFRVVPKCNSCNEEFDFAFMTTHEISKFCPTIVIATPDKIAYSLTVSPYEHTLYGATYKKCPKCKMCRHLMDSHQNESIHNCKNCNTQMDNSTRTQSRPSLLVFDEIQTLRGTSGNMFGHYMSLLKITNEKYGITKPLRFLGATATIANQEELVKNLTGFEEKDQQQFPLDTDYWVNSGKGYFEKGTEIRHRFVIVQPVLSTTLDSVERMALSGLNALQQLKNPTNLPAILQNVDIESVYKTQTIYVNRLKEAKRMYQSLPTRAMKENYTNPETILVSGQMTRNEIFTALDRVEKNEIELMITTSVLAQGVDFPNLNIVHFYGTPDSFVEMSQVAGRSGRSKYPSLVFLHMRADIPRDKSVYERCRKILNDIDRWYEPMPINVLNSYAMDKSLANVTHALIVTKQASDYRNMMSAFAHKNFQDPTSFKEFEEDLKKIYNKPWANNTEMTDQLNRLALTAYQHIDGAGGVTDTPFLQRALQDTRVLTGTLRETDVNVKVSEEE